MSKNSTSERDHAAPWHLFGTESMKQICSQVTAPRNSAVPPTNNRLRNCELHQGEGGAEWQTPIRRSSIPMSDVHWPPERAGATSSCNTNLSGIPVNLFHHSKTLHISPFVTWESVSVKVNGIIWNYKLPLDKSWFVKNLEWTAGTQITAHPLLLAFGSLPTSSAKKIDHLFN